jgi:hypothetical protein
MVSGQEFFKGTGRWPVAFTIWRYNEKKNLNKVKLLDLTELKGSSLSSMNWSDDNVEVRSDLKKLIRAKKEVALNNDRGDIRETLPAILHINKQIFVQQPRYDYSHAKRKEDYNKLVSGFPLSDKNRHFQLKRKCGEVNGRFVGFYDDNTPVRVKQDNYNRMSNEPDRVWFRLDSGFINVNQTRCMNGAPDNRGFVAYDLESAKATFSWFALTKALNGVYPIWANQFDIWKPNVNKSLESEYYSLCFVYALSENRCVVTRFEKDNPVKGAPEVFVDNPLCPVNPDSFWCTTLENQIKTHLAKKLSDTIKELYTYWNTEYCKGSRLENCGLKNEPYFQYFSYPDFLTPFSGLIQIRKYAEVNGKEDLLKQLDTIKELTLQVKNRIYELLVHEFDYFG